MTTIIKNLKKNRNNLFMIGLMLLMIQFWTQSSIKINEIIFYIPAFLLILFSIDLKEMSHKEIIILITINTLGVISYLFSKSMSVLKITIILSAMKNKSIDNIFKAFFSCGVLVMICNVIASTVFHSGNLFIEEDFGRGGVEKRYCIGFSHPNNLSLFINMILVLFLYTYYNKIKTRKYKVICNISLIFILFLVYYLTKSRTGLIMGVAILSLFMIYKYVHKIKFIKNYKFLISIYILIIVVVFALQCIPKNSQVYEMIDDVLTGRIKFAGMILERYGVNLLGQQISNMYDTNKGYSIIIGVDQGIVSSLLRYGILINLLFYLTQFVLIKKYCQQKKYDRIVIMLIMIIYAITEDILFYPFTNIAILFISDLIFNTKKRKPKHAKDNAKWKVFYKNNERNEIL